MSALKYYKASNFGSSNYHTYLFGYNDANVITNSIIKNKLKAISDSYAKDGAVFKKSYGSSTENIELPSQQGNLIVEVSSSNTNVISIDSSTHKACITQPNDADASVTITFSISYLGVKDSSTIIITVSKASGAVYKLDGTITGGTSGYDSESSITQNTKTWKVTGNTTQNPWRIGGKNLDAVDRTIYSTSIISSTDIINKVIVSVGAASSITVNSVSLIVSTNADFSNPISSLSTKFKANSDIEFDKPSNVDWSNCYFKIVFNVTNFTNTNRYVALNKIEFM